MSTKALDLVCCIQSKQASKQNNVKKPKRTSVHFYRWLSTLPTHKKFTQGHKLRSILPNTYGLRFHLVIRRGRAGRGRAGSGRRDLIERSDDLQFTAASTPHQEDLTIFGRRRSRLRQATSAFVLLAAGGALAGALRGRGITTVAVETAPCQLIIAMFHVLFTILVVVVIANELFSVFNKSEGVRTATAFGGRAMM